MKRKSHTTFYLSLFRIEGNIMISPPQFVLPRVWAGWRMLASASSWELWLMNCQEETEGLFVCRLELYFLPDFTFGLSQYRNITFINGVNLNQNKLRLSSFDQSKKYIEYEKKSLLLFKKSTFLFADKDEIIKTSFNNFYKWSDLLI